MLLRLFFDRSTCALLIVVLTLLLLGLTRETARARTVISEVMWAGSDVSSADEWVEMTCVEEAGHHCPADLSGWTLTSLMSGGEEVMILFATGTIITADEYFLIGNFTEGESRLSVIPNLVTTAVSLPNTKLLLRLRDSSGMLVDEVDDGVGEPFAGANPGGGVKASMERLDLLSPGTVRPNWLTAIRGIGFDSGALLLGTPGSPRLAPEPPPLLPESPPPLPPPMPLPSPPLKEEDPSSDPFPIVDKSAEQNFSSQSPVEPLWELKINEVLSDPEGEDSAEWFEILNIGKSPIVSHKLTIEDPSAGKVFVVPPLSGSVLFLPGQYRTFFKHQTNISLRNGGGMLLLKSSGALLDELVYPPLPKAVSFGRALDDPSVTRLFCVPTEIAPNELSLFSASIFIQSGEPVARERVSLNLEARMVGAPKESAECFWDFGDGSVSTSCNPPGHTYPSVGRYAVTLQAVSYCDNTVERILQVEVLPKPKSKEEKKNLSPSPSLFSPFLSSPSPQSKGADALPHCIPSIASGIVITELLPRPLEGFSEEWIELWNPMPSPQTLCGLFIQDASLKSSPLDGLRMPPRGYVLLPRSVSNIALNDDGDRLRLVSSGQTLQEVVYKMADKGKSFARGPDGSFSWTLFPTPGEENFFGRVKAFVHRVIDGDTVEIALLSRTPEAVLISPNPPPSLSPLVPVRLLGIDTPELFKDPPERYALEAKEFLRALVEGKNVDLEFDTELKDTYGRLLAFVHLEEGTLVQESLLLAGLAEATRPFPHSRKKEFVGLEAQAKHERQGLWAKPRKLSGGSGKAGKKSTKSSGTVGKIALQGLNVQSEPQTDFSSPSGTSSSGLSVLFIELAAMAGIGWFSLRFSKQPWF